MLHMSAALPTTATGGGQLAKANGGWDGVVPVPLGNHLQLDVSESNSVWVGAV